MLEAELGPPDVWVNNAMTSAFAPAWEITAEEYRRMAEVIYLGYVHGTLAALARMRPRDRGTIVQVGSALAYRGIRCRPPTAPPSTPSRASTTRSAPTCTTPAAGSG